MPKVVRVPAAHNDADNRIGLHGHLDRPPHLDQDLSLQTRPRSYQRSLPNRLTVLSSPRNLCANVLGATVSSCLRAQARLAPCVGHVGIELQPLSERRRGDDRRQRRAGPSCCARPAGCCDLADLGRPAHRGAMGWGGRAARSWFSLCKPPAERADVGIYAPWPPGRARREVGRAMPPGGADRAGGRVNSAR